MNDLLGPRPAGPAAAAPGDAEPDWAAAASFLLRRIRRLLPAAAPADVQDLAQEALIDAVRAHRHEPIRKPEALLTTLARRKAIDFVRRRDRWRVLIASPGPDGEDDVAELSGPEPGDPAERLDFIVHEFFGRETGEHSGCHELALAFLAGRQWSEVAAQRGCAEATVRKQWSRCMARVRRIMQREPHALWRWAGSPTRSDEDD